MQYELSTDRVVLPLIAAIHEHLRRKRRQLLLASTRITTRYADVVLAMPNTDPPILSAGDSFRYEMEYVRPAIPLSHNPVKFLRVAKLTQGHTPAMVRADAEAGLDGYKGYPDHPNVKDATTNSAGGVVDYFAMEATIAEIYKQGLVLLTHPEMPTGFCIDRQIDFLQVAEFLVRLAKKYQGRCTFEHANSAAMINFVDGLDYDGVLVTVTLQHLLDTLDDVAGGKLKVHKFCKPLPRRPEDRAVLREAFMTRNPRLAFGSDSAPHLRREKECREGCAGAWTAPGLIPMLISLVLKLCEGDAEWALRVLVHALSEKPRQFYRLPPPTGVSIFAPQKWTVPRLVGGAVPYLAGQELSYRQVRRVLL